MNWLSEKTFLCLGCGEVCDTYTALDNYCCEGSWDFEILLSRCCFEDVREAEPWEVQDAD